MDSKTCLLFVFFKLFVLSIAQDSSMDDSYCNYDYNGIYTANSTYKTYIQTIPNVLSGSDATFYNFSLGNRPDDTINVIALCRGDVEINRCQSCLRRAHYELAAKCTNQKESIIWKDECMLRYSDRAIFKVVNTLPNASGVNPVLAADANDFKKNVRSLLDKLKEEAGTGTSVLKFATGNFSVAGKSTVYGLVQCTPDLTTKQCEDCLNASFAELPSCCDGSSGGRVVMPSCNFRYETGSPFYNVTRVDNPQHSTPGKGNDDRKKKVIIVIVAITLIPLVSLVVCIGGIYICYYRNKKHNMYSKGFSDVSVEMSREEAVHYDFYTVKRATKGFSDDNKLGRGAFGPVYKGTLGDREIAVKKLLKLTPEGEKAFKTEVVVLGNLQHRNLVKLRGYSITARERLLIYEFIANGSLDNYIYDREKRSNLNWDTRFEIITGVARGLLYLHEDSRHRIIHRDMKPGNILLDSNMCPKIADFGLAKFFKDEVTRVNTRVAGTRGYIAPEYWNGGTLSVKSDVFSFGVVVLEIITGLKHNFVNGENDYLPIYVWKKWRDGRYLDVIDPKIESVIEDSILEMKICIHIALLCVQTNVGERPTMRSVVGMLSKPSEPPDLQMPSAPQDLQMPSERQEIPSEPQKEPLTLSNNDVSITDLTGR